MIILLIVLNSILIVWGYMEWNYWVDRKNEEAERMTEEWLNKIPHTQHLISEDYMSALLLNEMAEVIYLVEVEHFLDEDFEIEDIPFHKAIEVALIVDGMIEKAFPPDGIIVSEGSMVDDKEEDDEVESIGLRFVVDDLANPIKEFIYLDEKRAISRDSEGFEEAFENCNDWYVKLMVLIKRNKHDKVKK